MAYKKSIIPDFRKATVQLGKVAPLVALETIQDFADRECAAFIERINEQDFKSFDATPLSDAWAAKKSALKLDPRTMIATKDYINHIRVFVREQPDGSKLIYIGFDDTDRVKDRDGHITDFPMWLLACVQEFGSVKARVPARPHWGPFFEEMNKRAVPLRKRIGKSIMQQV